MNRILCAPCDAPLDEQSCDQDHLLRSAIDAYLAAGSDSVTFASAFAAWAAGAGLQYERRAGVLVSLDEEGHVLAAAASPEIGTLREIAWAIVKDAPGMAATGHAAAVRWARRVGGAGARRSTPAASASALTAGRGSVSSEEKRRAVGEHHRQPPPSQPGAG